jgi:hypothetical protein
MPAPWMPFAGFAFAPMGSCVKLAPGQHSIAPIKQPFLRRLFAHPLVARQAAHCLAAST